MTTANAPYQKIRSLPVAERDPLISRGSLATLGLAALLGLAGEQLLWQQDALGINAALWILLLLGASRALHGRTTEQPVGQGRWLLLALGFSLCFAIRDADWLGQLNFLAVGLALALPAIVYQGNPRRVRLTGWIQTAARAAGMVWAGAAFLFFRADWSTVKGNGTRRAAPILWGLLIALPVVAVFTALFSSADPAFERLATALFRWDAEALFQHAVLAGALAWLAAGLLRAWLWKPTYQGTALGEIGSIPAIGPVPVAIVLGSMASVFALFVALQARYLFGGAAIVLTPDGPGFAEYARRGFFELVAASGLAIPLLYGGAAMLGPAASATSVRRIRLLSGIQLALIGAVMVSAVSRMLLYVDAYGLTEDRILATAILGWLALVIGWFASTVLRGKPERFTFGAVTSGFAVLAGLNAVNPDALIARVNTTRARSVAQVDYEYLRGLGADAVPNILAALPAMTVEQRCDVQDHLRRKWRSSEGSGWQSWNLARSRARALQQDETAECRESKASRIAEEAARQAAATATVAGTSSVPAEDSTVRVNKNAARRQ